jgi:hypothetical protein
MNCRGDADQPMAIIPAAVAPGGQHLGSRSRVGDQAAARNRRTPTFEAVRELAGSSKPAQAPTIAKATVDLSDYDSLLASGDQHG